MAASLIKEAKQTTWLRFNVERDQDLKLSLFNSGHSGISEQIGLLTAKNSGALRVLWSLPKNIVLMYLIRSTEAIRS